MPDTPEAPPPVLPVDPPEPDPATIRKSLLSHEANIRSIGFLYYLAAILMPLAAVGAVTENENRTVGWVVAALLLVFALVYWQLGRWFRRLEPRGRRPATVLALVGLLAFPFGTLINAYILYLIHSPKGRRVFSPEYRAVVEATPEIRYRSSIYVLGLIVFLVLVVLAFLAMPLSNTP